MYTHDLNKILTSFARKITGRYDVEDLVQQAFLKMKLNEEKFDGKNEIAWACTILKNEFINELRKEKGAIKEQIETAKQTISPDKADELINVYFIEKQIEKLTPKLKGVFNDFVFGYSYKEIAERNNINDFKVKSRLYQARQVLIKNLAI